MLNLGEPGTQVLVFLVVMGGLPLIPVLAASLVLLWNGIRGSDPGPSGALLLTLVALVLEMVRRGRDPRRLLGSSASYPTSPTDPPAVTTAGQDVGRPG